MFFQTEGQFLILLACIFGGVVIGLIYDVLHFFSVPKLKSWLNAILDVIFVVAAAAVFILVTYLSSFGEVRLFNLAGFIAGFIAEQITLKILVAKAVRRVYNYIIKIIKNLAARMKRKRPPKKRKNDRKPV